LGQVVKPSYKLRDCVLSVVMAWDEPLSNWVLVRLADTRLTVPLLPSAVPLPTCRNTRREAAARLRLQAWALANCPPHTSSSAMARHGRVKERDGGVMGASLSVMKWRLENKGTDGLRGWHAQRALEGN
jgi:hypothetical protein